MKSIAWACEASLKKAFSKDANDSLKSLIIVRVSFSNNNLTRLSYYLLPQSEITSSLYFELGLRLK